MAQERQPELDNAQRESAQDNSGNPALAELGLRDVDDPAPQGSRAMSPDSVQGPQEEVHMNVNASFPLPPRGNPTRIEIPAIEPPMREATAVAIPANVDPIHTLVQGLLNQLNQRNTENQNRDNGTPNQSNFLRMVKTMKSLGTYRFKGGYDPLEADAWIQNMEKNFEATRCPEEFKLDIATYYLEKDASNWWTNISTYFRNHSPTYNNFRAEFKQKYFPPEARDRLESQFMDLAQGSKSVREFEVEFTRLRKYTHYGIDHEDMIIRKFMKGLRADIKSRLQAVQYHDLYELVERAVNVEEGIAEEKAAMLAQRRPDTIRPNFSRPRFQGGRPFGQGRLQRRGGNNNGTGRPPRGRFGGNGGNGGSSSTPRNPLTCYQCGQVGHTSFYCPMRRTMQNTVNCYRCGEAGHYATSCPRGQPAPIRALPPSPEERRAIEPAPKRPAIAGRVYALGVDNPRPSQPGQGLITGTYGY